MIGADDGLNTSTGEAGVWISVDLHKSVARRRLLRTAANVRRWPLIPT